MGAKCSLISLAINCLQLPQGLAILTALAKVCHWVFQFAHWIAYLLVAILLLYKKIFCREVLHIVCILHRLNLYLVSCTCRKWPVLEQLKVHKSLQQRVWLKWMCSPASLHAVSDHLTAGKMMPAWRAIALIAVVATASVLLLLSTPSTVRTKR